MNFLKVHILLNATSHNEMPTYFRKDRIVSFGYHPNDKFNYIEILDNNDYQSRIPVKEEIHEILTQLEGH